MDKQQYNFIKKFPIDMSYLKLKQIEDMTKGEFDYNALFDICQKLHSADLLSGAITNSGLRITPKGLNAISNYEATTKKEDEIAELQLMKLKVDIKNAERIYKSYPWTQFIAWASFTVAILLGFLKVAELLKLLPYHK